MALIRFSLLTLAVVVVTIAAAIRYDAVSIPVIDQLVVNSEFELALLAFVLAVTASALSRRARR